MPKTPIFQVLVRIADFYVFDLWAAHQEGQKWGILHDPWNLTIKTPWGLGGVSWDNEQAADERCNEP